MEAFIANIELHLVDGWETLYVNGECVRDRRLTLASWISARLKRGRPPVTIKSLEVIYHEDDAVAAYFHQNLRLPETLAELKELEAQ